MRFFNDKDLKSRKRKFLEEEKILKELKDKAEFEKGDFLALIFAALITLLPIVLGILFLYYVITMHFFG
ncbi:hypothetical protein [Alkaliphilus serpentinus]|uniref:Uncharacterized protein n=1 Tax=Alkaliphilus serpentinus TaxID=1482731 RepID=A0A833M8H2_9FIRM|nr:hypothetical protein [Alkaliphilus serpentinus]KAB3533096.1 hypothetical protein F8153_00675 [Alkaliphilus serpentinus]